MKVKFIFSLAVLLAAISLVHADPYKVSGTELSISQISDALVGAGVAVTPSPVERIIGGGSNTEGIRSFSDFHAEVVDNAGELYKPFTDGIVFSTGKASGGCATGGANTSLAASEVDTPWPNNVTDIDLANLIGRPKGELGDAAGVVFVVCPSNRTINIPLMVASEEYFLTQSDWGWWQDPSLEEYQDFPDAFAFFVEKGIVASSSDQVSFTNNIAKLPNGDNLSIATVNPFTNLTYFVANVTTNEYEDLILPCDLIPMEYNAAIIGPCAVMTNVTPNVPYTIKIVVADGGNSPAIDTAVFLKSKGITSGADLKLTVAADPTSILDVGAGKTGRFTFKVENIGPAPAEDVVLTNFFPVCLGDEWTTDAPGFWELGLMEHGDVITKTLDVTFGDDAINYSGICVSGIVVTATGDYDMRNNSDSAEIVFTTTGQGSVSGLVWNDGDKDGLQGDGESGIADSTVELYTNTVSGAAFRTTATSSDGTYSFDHLPANTYVVHFVAPDGFDTFTLKDVGEDDTVDSDAAAGFPLAASDADPLVITDAGESFANVDAGLYLFTTNLVATKVWDDADDQDGIRPASVSFSLYGDGDFAASGSASASTDWSSTFADIPVYTNLTAISYTLVEDPVPDGYDETIAGIVGGWVVTNTHIPAVTNIVAVKEWDDSADQDGLRTDSVTLSLYTNGALRASSDVSDANGWTAEWTGLPVNAAGEAIAYEVREDVVPAGYTASAAFGNGKWTVTNKHQPAVTNVVAVKEWDDADDQDGLRTGSVILSLYTNGALRASSDVSDANGWTAEWTSLPVNAAGEAIAYEVREDEVPAGYTASAAFANGKWTVTNKHQPAVTNVVAVKEWNDADDQDGLRTGSVTLSLYTNGALRVSTDVSDANGWTAEWTSLPVNAAGEAIAYEVREDVVPAGYTASAAFANGKWTVTNKHQPAVTNVVAVKVWDDADDQDGLRTDSVTLSLYTNGALRASSDVSDANGWTAEWTGLPVNAAGEAIAYEVREDVVPAGYTASAAFANGKWTVTNKHQPAVTNVVAVKVWDDADNQDNLRPGSVSLSLYTNGALRVSSEVSDGNDWTVEWTGLPVCAAGKAVSYEVREDVVPDGYAKSISRNGNVWTVKNVHGPAITNIVVTKVWEDSNDQDGVRPDSVTVSLFTNDASCASCELASSNDWSHVWTDMPVYMGGAVLAYDVREDVVPDGYTNIVVSSGYSWTVKNFHEPAVTNVVAVKAWDDADDQDGLRTDSVTLSLYTNGALRASSDVSDSNGWTAEWTDLPVNAAGEAIAYEVREDVVPTGYTASAAFADGKWTVTNKHQPAVTNLVVVKAWDDGDNRDSLRPGNVDVSFYTNGVLGATVTLTESMGWSNVWSGLPVNAAGEAISYEVREDVVPAGYTNSVSGSGFEWTVTNSHDPAVTNVCVAKVWDDNGDRDGLRPAKLPVTLYADGTPYETVELTEANGWTNAWTGLYVNADGAPITYSVSEDSIPAGYTASSFEVGGVFTITNSHCATAEIHGVVWDDADIDSVIDSSETRLSGVSVTIAGSGFSTNLVTDSQGGYVVSNLWTGAYTVSVALPEDYVMFVQKKNDSDVEGGTGASAGTRSFTLPAMGSQRVNAGVCKAYPELAVRAEWTLNRSTGLIEGVLKLTNSGKAPYAADTDFWLATPGARPTWYVWNPTGRMPDGSDYYNLTAAVRAAVAKVGNRDAVLDPGETVSVKGLQIYHVKRYSPDKYLDVQLATHAGYLFQSADANRNFVVSDAELATVVAGWSAGGVSDGDLLEATRLNAGAAYIWGDADANWKTLDADCR